MGTSRTHTYMPERKFIDTLSSFLGWYCDHRHCHHHHHHRASPGSFHGTATVNVLSPRIRYKPRTYVVEPKERGVQTANTCMYVSRYCSQHKDTPRRQRTQAQEPPLIYQSSNSSPHHCPLATNRRPLTHHFGQRPPQANCTAAEIGSQPWTARVCYCYSLRPLTRQTLLSRLT